MTDRCPDEAEWLRYLDQETDPAEQDQFEGHLRSCTGCRHALRRVAELAAWTEEAWEGVPPMGLAGPVGGFFRRGPWRVVAGVAAAVLVAALLAIPGRGALAEFFQTFRPHHLAGVSFTPEEIAAIQSRLGSQGRISLRQFGSVETRVAPGPPRSLPLAEIPARTGLPLVWPRTLSGPGVSASFTGPGELVLRLNVPAVNQFIRMEGGTRFLPQGVNGMPITLQVPAQVTVAYAAPTRPGRMPVSYFLTEMRTPTLRVPARVGMGQVVAAVQSLPFLPTSLQESLGALRHWRNTLVLPMPGNGQSIRFHGAPALVDRVPGNHTILLVWLQHGVLYSLTYQGPLDTQRFLRQARGWFS